MCSTREGSLIVNKNWIFGKDIDNNIFKIGSHLP